MSRIPNIFQRLTGAETPMEDDVTSLSKDIDRIRTKADLIKRLADELKDLDDLLKKIERTKEKSYRNVVKTIYLNEFDGRFHELVLSNSEAAKRLSAKVEDAVREYVGESIRTTYEALEKVKEEF